MRATKFLTEAEKQQVEAALAEAERRTSAQIVCAVATGSGRYDRAESCVGLAAALLALCLAEVLAAWLAPDASWEHHRPALWLQCLAVGLGFAIGSVVASYWHGLRNLFVPASEIEAETQRAAARVFTAHGLADTAGGAAVLLYLSLAERRLVVLANRKALAVAGPSLAGEVRDIAASELRAGRRLEALTRPLEPIAATLAEANPPDSEPHVEISNALLTFHPRP